MFTGISFDPMLMGDLHDESRRWVNNSQDPESEPDPEFVSMRFEEIAELLWQYEQEERLDYDEWEQANRVWFQDHRISHG